ncbi:MAG: PepSY-associated TM helix domain-containing protein [Candidatus Pseudobacter hemicellulosilyticus]|uniref:PepSY-associated TM helix domain-containing protein n=1 Tax=Candidatus Pseudobacter hemicellulosilyticus TaxID=3121375 RepID=A0AAJ6BG82_9BACT|nr:MAG: PepSY-associated TM helix domain-containing protein [Pseudobacter sp.]
MWIRKIIGKLHLWLGLISGFIVLMLAVTGCIYAFQQEIQDATQPYRHVAAQSSPFLPPSRLHHIADSANPHKHVHAIRYAGPESAAQAIYYEYLNYYDIVFLNPYTGEVLKVKDMEKGFFPFILEGHFYLWLPHSVGQPVVAVATLIFFVMVISGIILWWPRNKAGARQRFTIKWNARWRRRNYDLHNVLGFYVSWIGLIFAVTGLVWGFQWFSKTAYWVSSGGKQQVEFYDPGSDTTAVLAQLAAPAPDLIWEKMKKEYPDAGSLEVHIPEGPGGSIEVGANPSTTSYWKADYRYFDQYTLKELPVKHTWGRVDQANGGDLFMRMNYDIHTGAIWGLPGKILAFCGSLLIGSLPITGFLIWLGRKKKTAAKKSAVPRTARAPRPVTAEV